MLTNADADGAYLICVGKVAGRNQHLARVALGEDFQRLSAAGRKYQLMPFVEQFNCQTVTDTAAGTGQPDALAHASLLFSQRMAGPSSGRCS
jgi:hypothetical protein